MRAAALVALLLASAASAQIVPQTNSQPPAPSAKASPIPEARDVPYPGTIQLTVDARNKRAQACYRKCGFVEEARLRQHRYAEGELHDTLWMGVLRDEWEARR